MTVYCERDTQKPGNVCIKCNGTWSAGTPLPACSAMGTNAPLPTLNHSLNEILKKVDENAAAAAKPIPESITQRFEIPLAILRDPVVRDLAPNEPFFVLRASDLLADYLVERWAMNAESHGCDPKTVQAARTKAGEMRAWAGERRYPQ